MKFFIQRVKKNFLHNTTFPLLVTMSCSFLDRFRIFLSYMTLNEIFCNSSDDQIVRVLLRPTEEMKDKR